MRNQITIKGVVITAKPNTARKIEFAIPSDMNGKAFSKFQKEHKAEIEAFRASVDEGTSEDEGDIGVRH